MSRFLALRPGTSPARLRAAAGASLLVASLAVPLTATPTAAAEPAATGEVVSSTGGGVQPLAPARLLDTRATGRTVDGAAQASGATRAGQSLTLQLAGRGGVPSTGAGAVVLNLTATQPSGSGHLTVHPTGTDRPNASNLNFAKGQTVPNLVLAKLGTQGRIQIAASTATHMIVDVMGWVPESRDVQPVQPARVLDTRGTGRTIDGQSQATGALRPGETRRLPIAGRGGVPRQGVGAVVVNLTAVAPTHSGYLTVHPGGTARPNASTLNLVPGQVIPNLVIAKLGADGALSVFNSTGTTAVVADVVGFLPEGAAYTSLVPARLLDTRTTGRTVDAAQQGGGPLAAGETRRLPVAGRGGVPADGVDAVVVNLTGTGPTAATHLTVFQSGASRPNASNLNLGRGSTRANLVVAQVGADGQIAIANAAGSVHVVADVVGWFASGGSTYMELQPGTVLAGPGDVRSYSGDAESGATAVLDPSADVPPVGGQLYVPPTQSTPSGLSGHVVGVEPAADGTTRVLLEPADLQDLFIQFKVSSSVTAHDVPVTPSGTTGARLTHSVCQFENGNAADGVSLPHLVFRDVSGTFDFDLLEAYSRLDVRITPTATWSMQVTSGLSCQFDVQTVPFLLGPLALEYKPRLSLSVSGGEGGFALEAAAPSRIGHIFDDGNVQNLNSASLTGSASGNAADQPVSVTLTPAIVISAKLGGIAGLEGDLGVPITGSLVDQCVELTAALSVGLSVVAERWGIGWRFELARIELLEKVLHRSGVCGEAEWTGTIRTTYSYTYPAGAGPQANEHTGRVTYSDIEVSSPSSDTYHATVMGSGTHDTDSGSGCPSTGTWSAAGSSESAAWAGYPVLTLENQNDGVHLGVSFLNPVHRFTSPCGPDSLVSTSAAGYESGSTGIGTDPLPDSDPDPAVLRGSVTYTLGDPPIELVNSPTTYSFSVTYDLQLVSGTPPSS